jgi:hypothetical protein
METFLAYCYVFYIFISWVNNSFSGRLKNCKTILTKFKQSVRDPSKLRLQNASPRDKTLRLGQSHSGQTSEHDGVDHRTDATIHGTPLIIERAVEVLEDKYCEGFEFFNHKIQNLLKKRSIV